MTASWNVEDTPEGRHIRLAGAWNLLSDAAERRRVARGLRQIGVARELIWDLHGVEELDSAGVLVLWQTWGRTWPKALHSRPGQRKWFERLQAIPGSPRPTRPEFWQPLAQFGAGIVAFVQGIAGVAVLVGQLALDIVHSWANPRTAPWREISANIYRVGATSLFLLGGVAILIGVVTTYQLALSLRHFGANTLIIRVFPLAVLRELAPVITALIVTARSGAAMTAGIGAMQLTSELDALRAFGSSPTQRLVLPKVLAMALSMPLLVLWFDVLAMAGGVFTADFSLDVPYPMYIGSLPEAISWVNLWIGLIKGFVFGVVVGIVSGHFGLKIKGNTQSLGNKTTTSVVAGITLVILIDTISGAMLTNVGLFK